MEVLAFTAGGDGVRAPRIYCQTEQDGTHIHTHTFTILLPE